MKKDLLKILSLCALFLGTSMVFSSCDDDKEDDKVNPEPIIDPVETVKKMYILNEGIFKSNNSTLDLYLPDTKTFESKVYASQNAEVIGDTGQDLIVVGDKLFLSVFGSNYLAKLDSNGKLIEKYSFSQEEGQPRFLAFKDNSLYVSLYSGQIAKFDTASLDKPVAYVTVGNNPEQIAIKDNFLVVCNSQLDNVPDNRISIVDLSNFTLSKNIETSYGNFQSVAVVNDSVYVTYYTPTYSIEMLNVDINSGVVRPSGAATKMLEYNNNLYCANVATVYDENRNATTNTSFFVRNVNTGKDTPILDLSATPELATATVYLFDIDSDTHDLYIGTTDYKTNGTIYRFDKDGKLLDKFETSSISPSKAVFLVN